MRPDTALVRVVRKHRRGIGDYVADAVFETNDPSYTPVVALELVGGSGRVQTAEHFGELGVNAEVSVIDPCIRTAPAHGRPVWVANHEGAPIEAWDPRAPLLVVPSPDDDPDPRGTLARAGFVVDASPVRLSITFRKREEPSALSLVVGTPLVAASSVVKHGFGTRKIKDELAGHVLDARRGYDIAFELVADTERVTVTSAWGSTRESLVGFAIRDVVTVAVRTWSCLRVFVTDGYWDLPLPTSDDAVRRAIKPLLVEHMIRAARRA